MSNPEEVSITNTLGPFSALPVWIGIIWSKFWFAPQTGVANFAISRTQTKLMNGHIQVAGDQWPVFLYANYTYYPEDPWNGLLHSGLLVSVGLQTPLSRCYCLTIENRHSSTSSHLPALWIKNWRRHALAMHAFTECEMLLRHPLATLLHRYVHLLSMIVPPIEWWQARFALTSAQVFSHTDLVTDSECFYTSIIDLLDDPDEKDKVKQLLMWWNRYGPHIDSFLYWPPIQTDIPSVCRSWAYSL